MGNSELNGNQIVSWAKAAMGRYNYAENSNVYNCFACRDSSFALAQSAS